MGETKKIKQTVSMLGDNVFVKNFFSMSDECNFPGCEELRAQYLEEKRKNVKGCAACRRFSLIKKYKSIITNRLNIT